VLGLLHSGFVPSSAQMCTIHTEETHQRKKLAGLQDQLVCALGATVQVMGPSHKTLDEGTNDVSGKHVTTSETNEVNPNAAEGQLLINGILERKGLLPRE